MIANLRRKLPFFVLAWFCQIALAASPGVTDTKVVFGETIGLDSVWGPLYTGYSEGMLKYFQWVNAKGGVHGRQLEVIRLEDNYVTATAVANIERFGQKSDVLGLLCIGGTAITEAAMPLLEEFRLPTVGTLTGSESVRGFNRYLFHTRASYSAEIQKMIEHLETVGITRVAVVYQNNSFGRNVLAATQLSVKDKRVQLVALVAHPAKDWKITDIVEPLASAHPQAVIMFSASATVAEVVKGYRKITGKSIPTPWVLSVTSPAKLSELLGEDARGIAVMQIMPNPGSGVSRLSRRYRSEMGQNGVSPNLSYEALEGYVTGRIVVEALTRAGRNLTRETYIQALESMGDYKVDDLAIKYSPQSHAGPTFVDPSIMGHQGVLMR
ncbi:MAG: ABC transporter substrate-binding protein [Gallionella sp.]|nr:ABC transporter substrate-binding protein [Gallionella sp.]